MRFGQGAGLVEFRHHIGGFVRVFLGVFPALHRGTHKPREAVFKDIEPILPRRHALVLVFEGHQVIGCQPRIHDLPVLAAGHGQDAIGLPVQEQIDVEALLEDVDPGASPPSVGIPSGLIQPRKGLRSTAIATANAATYTPAGIFIGSRSTLRGEFRSFHLLSARAADEKAGRGTNLPRPGCGCEFWPQAQITSPRESV